MWRIVVLSLLCAVIAASQISNPIRDWALPFPFHTARNVTSATADGYLYVAAGENATGTFFRNVSRRSLNETNTNGWETLAELPNSIGPGVRLTVVELLPGHSTIAACDAGNDNCDALAVSTCYVLNNSVWVALPSISTKRCRAAVVGAGNTLFVVGGGSEGSPESYSSYSFSAAQWSEQNLITKAPTPGETKTYDFSALRIAAFMPTGTGTGEGLLYFEVIQGIDSKFFEHMFIVATVFSNGTMNFDPEQGGSLQSWTNVLTSPNATFNAVAIGGRFFRCAISDVLNWDVVIIEAFHPTAQAQKILATTFPSGFNGFVFANQSTLHLNALDENDERQFSSFRVLPEMFGKLNGYPLDVAQDDPIIPGTSTTLAVNLFGTEDVSASCSSDAIVQLSMDESCTAPVDGFVPPSSSGGTNCAFNVVVPKGISFQPGEDRRLWICFSLGVCDGTGSPASTDARNSVECLRAGLCSSESACRDRTSAMVNGTGLMALGSVQVANESLRTQTLPPTSSATGTLTEMNTPSKSIAPTQSASLPPTPSSTETLTSPLTPSATKSFTPTLRETLTESIPPTRTKASTPSLTSAKSATRTVTHTAGEAVATLTSQLTPSATQSSTPTLRETITESIPPTRTKTQAPSTSATVTLSLTASEKISGTVSGTNAPSASLTGSRTPSVSSSPTNQPTQSRSQTVTRHRHADALSPNDVTAKTVPVMAMVVMAGVFCVAAVGTIITMGVQGKLCEKRRKALGSGAPPQVIYDDGTAALLDTQGSVNLDTMMASGDDRV